MYLLNKVTNLLPAKLRPYAKAVWPLVLATVGAGVSWVTRGVWDPSTITLAAGGVAHSLVTLLVSNGEAV